MTNESTTPPLSPKPPFCRPVGHNPVPTTPHPTTQKSLASLITGYQRFRSCTYKTHETTYRELGRGGQTPPVLVVGCADSRCDPSVIFDAPPGELFVMRNVANLVPPYCPDGKFHGVSAGLEYAINVLKVEHVVIMGHGKCGGICACLQGDDMDPNALEFVGPWVGMLKSAREKVLASGTINPQYALELEGIELSLTNLMTFPWVAKRVEEGTLQLHGSWFAIEHGELHWRNARNGRFEVVPTSPTVPLPPPVPRAERVPSKDMSRSNSISDLVNLRMGESP